MPDLLAHYASSVLVATRVRVDTRIALLIGLVGLIPDVDALLRIHRWITHSLVLVALFAIPLITLVYWRKRRYFGLALTTLLIYTLHLLLDIFTGPTPILYPLADSIWIKIQVNGASTATGITVTSSITVATMKPDFTQREIVEGPLVTETGAIIAVVTAVILLLEYFIKAKNQ
jgi:F0F1-type ATP synthase membrane subunit c/vacuolar-type H+-ATPase subunit K